MAPIPYDYDQEHWGSRKTYPDGALTPWRVDKDIVHYGGGANFAGNPNWADVRTPTEQILLEMRVLRIWQDYHIDSKGWVDIAYAYAVGQSGMIYRLRGENRLGATRGDLEPDGIPENHEARAVVFILGGTQQPTVEALDAFRRIWQAEPLPVSYHRAVFRDGEGGTDTQCPGDWLANWIDEKGYETPMTTTHTHKVDPATLPRSWADSIWAQYIKDGGTTVPESRTWEAYREDLAWLEVKFIAPLRAQIEELADRISELSEGTIPADVDARLAELEAFMAAIKEL